LAPRGFQKGDVFAIYSPNVLEYAVALHAVATLGGIATTANPLSTPRELALQLSDARAKYLVTIPQLLDHALEATRQAPVKEVFVFGEAAGASPFAALMEGGDDVPAVTIDPRNDLVALPYSSGTTGLPKGVMLTHRNLVANVEQACGDRLKCFVAQGYGLTETSPVVSTTPVDPLRRRGGSAGLLIPNTECKVMDPSSGAELGAGEQGEVWIRGPQVMTG